MSWFKRKKDWAAKETLTAADLDGEFDNVAEALNGLFQAGHVSASENLALGTTMQDIPGTSASITVARASLAIITTAFTTEGSAGFSGVLYVGGSEVSPAAANNEVAAARVTVGQTYCVSLAAGAHAVKLRAVIGQTPLLGSRYCYAAGTGFTYLVIPNPEP